MSGRDLHGAGQARETLPCGAHAELAGAVADTQYQGEALRVEAHKPAHVLAPEAADK